jgi:hypothetical protein
LKYVYVGVAPTTLASGQPVQFGDSADLNKLQVRANAHLIDAGRLVPQSTGKEGDQ